MLNRETTRTRLLVAVAGTGLVLSMASMVAAGEDEKRTTTDAPADVLRGPEVEDRDVPGVDSSFGDSEMKPARDKERPVPHRVFMGSLRSLMGKDAPEALRATEEQRDQVREIEDEFKAAQRAFRDEHGQEMRELMEIVRPRGEGREGRQGRGEPGERGRRGQRGEEGERGERGERPQRGEGQRGERGGQRGRERGGEGRGRIDPESLNEEQRAAFERVKEIRTSGPQAATYHAKMWDVLSEGQREFVKEQLAETRERGEQGKRGKGERKQRQPAEDGERRRERDRDGGRT